MLAALVALALAADPPPAPPPIDCPPGGEVHGAAPFDGYEAWCEARDTYGRPRRHGPSRTWYDDGKPWVNEAWKDGARDGPFVEYHRNGRKAREGAYAAGRKTGRWVVWYESGVLEEETTWRDGVLQGEFTAYWPEGKVRTRGRHCGGAQCGRWLTYDREGHELGSIDYGEQSDLP
jgi:antitoxin component YwqK of YwqJK toxin-antitoxin module